MVRAQRPCSSPLPLRYRSTNAEAFSAIRRLETLDNGKPIRESRDIDIPLVVRHFYHHAGWAQLLADEFPGYEPIGVCRSNYSLELSSIDVGLENSAGVSGG